MWRGPVVGNLCIRDKDKMKTLEERVFLEMAVHVRAAHNAEAAVAGGSGARSVSCQLTPFVKEQCEKNLAADTRKHCVL